MAGHKCLLFLGHSKKLKQLLYSFWVMFIPHPDVKFQSFWENLRDKLVWILIWVAMCSTVTSREMILSSFWKSLHKSCLPTTTASCHFLLLPFALPPLHLLPLRFLILSPFLPLAPSSLCHMTNKHLFYHFIWTSKKRYKRLILFITQSLADPGSDLGFTENCLFFPNC